MTVLYSFSVLLLRSRTVAPKRSKFLQESEHEVSEGGPQQLVAVAYDVRPVLFQLDQRVLGLQVQDVSICRLLHLNLCDAVLQIKTTFFK